jgi:hypothetical protein
VTPSKFRTDNQEKYKDLCKKIDRFDLNTINSVFTTIDEKFMLEIMEENNSSIYDPIFRIGVVNSVNGREVKILVDRNKNTSHLIYKGELIKNVAVGSYIKVLKGFESIIGKVESEYIEQDKILPSGYSSPEDLIKRYLVVKLIGHIHNNEYVKGITELPLIDNECYLLTNDEFLIIHSLRKEG